MSLGIKLNESFDNPSGLPLFTRDPLINAGSLFLLDFLDATCNPHADGAVATLSTMKNLVDGKPDATINGAGYSNAAGKTGLVSAGTATNLTIGAAGSFDLNPTNAEFIVTQWLKTPAVGFLSTNFARLFTMGAGANGNTKQWHQDTGSGGAQYRFQYGTGAGVQNQQQSGQNTNAPRHYGMHVKPSTGLLALYVNGVLVGSTTGSGAFTLQSAASDIVQFNGAWIGTLYRLYQENISLSGADPRVQIERDYTLNVGRFA